MAWEGNIEGMGPRRDTWRAQVLGGTTGWDDLRRAYGKMGPEWHGGQGAWCGAK